MLHDCTRNRVACLHVDDGVRECGLYKYQREGRPEYHAMKLMGVIDVGNGLGRWVLSFFLLRFDSLCPVRNPPEGRPEQHATKFMGAIDVGRGLGR